MPDQFSWLETAGGIGIVCGALLGLGALLNWGWKTVSNIVRIRDSLLHPQKGALAKLQEITETLNPPGQPGLNERLGRLEHQDQQTVLEIQRLKTKLEDHINSPHPHPNVKQ